MSSEKRLLYISNRIFWPPMGGHEAETYHYCRGLHEKYGYLIDVYAFDSEDKLKSVRKPEFLREVFLAKPIKKITKINNLVFKSFLSEKKWPLQNALYYSKENANLIRQKIINNKYDLIIVDMIRLASYFDSFKDLKCKKILDIDDTLSKRYERQLNAITKKTNIAGQYNSKLPLLFQKLLEAPGLKKVILKLEIPRMRKAEEYYSKLYDNVIFVSALETKEFNCRYKTEKSVTVSLGVDYPFYSEDIEVSKVDGRVTYVGNLFTSANADSVRMIINNILPKSKNVKEIMFIGKCPDNLKKEFQMKENVIFTGEVDDLRRYVKSGMVFLTPIAYGTGIKTKILEAMAMKMPVVTNSIGAEGIHARNNEHWYVSDNYDELARKIDELLLNEDLRKKMGENSQKFVKDFFQWDIVFEQFKKLNL